MLFASWIFICLVFVLATNRKLEIAITTALVLWLAIPWVASESVTGVPLEGAQVIPSMHPATWLVLITFVVHFFLLKNNFMKSISSHGSALLAVTLFILIACVLTLIFNGAKGITSIIYLIIVPVMYLVLILSCHQNDPSCGIRFRNAFLIACGLQSILSLVQYNFHKVFLYESFYQSQYWWKNELTRSIGTTDHPLMLALLLVAGTALSLGLSNKLLAISLTLLFTLSLLTTGSRTGILVSALIVVWYILGSRISSVLRVLLATSVLAMLFVVLNGDLFQTSIERFNDDSGSTRVRLLAYRLFGDVWSEYLFVGGGASHSFAVLDQAGLETSFESTILTFSIDYGLIPTLIFFLALLRLATRRRRDGVLVPGSIVAALGAFILFQSYSGGTVQSSVASILWFLTALACMRQKPLVEQNTSPNGHVPTFNHRSL